MSSFRQYPAAPSLSHTGPFAAAGPTAVVTAGTPGPDTIHGSNLVDTLSGGAGDDTVYGYAGDDTLEGGIGNDQLFGGTGNDALSDWYGRDALYGGDGDDQLQGNPGVVGAPASIEGSGLLDGGAGNDVLNGYNGYDFAGGAGDDLISVRLAGGVALQSVIDGGDGADRIEFLFHSRGQGQLTVTGGAGIDTYHLIGVDPAQASLARIRITDFAAGAGGDQLAMGWLLPPELSGNPFATGLFRLGESGADTLVQLRQFGAAGGYLTLVELAGVRPELLSSANFLGNFDPTGKSAVGETLAGTALGESLYGGPLDDTILGLDGDDYLWGAGGNDRLEGGAGKDQLVGQAGDDILMGGDGNDRLFDKDPQAGNNQFDGGPGDDEFFAGDGNDRLSGGAGLDTAWYTELRTFYAVNRRDGGFQLDSALAGTGGSDLLEGVERIRFKGSALALDTDGVAGQTYRIYRAAFDRAPDLGGMGFWLAAMDKGTSLVDIAAGFTQSKEFADLYGSAPSNEQIVTRLYTNILHRAPEPAGYAYWLDILDSGKASLPAVLAAISESQENRDAVAALIANGIDYTFYY